MTTVYLIRHAEATGNRYRRCHGQYDSVITDLGYRQIAALAKRFEHVQIDAVYSSDMTRTQTTALAITRVHDLPLHTTPRLREVGVGEWEDRSWTWLTRFEHDKLVAFNTDAGHWQVRGGESMEQVRERMLGALREIIAAHPNQTVALFSHGMALRLLIGTLQGMSIAEIDKTGHGENTAVTKLEAEGNDIRVVYRDDASHLDESLMTLHKQAWIKNKDGVEPGMYFLPDRTTEGRFEAFAENECVGATTVKRTEDGVALVEEFRLDDAMRRRGYGERLLGQTLSCARTLDCDTLRCVLARDNEAGGRFARRNGFHAVEETAERVVFEKYFGRDELYRIARFEEALAQRT